MPIERLSIIVSELRSRAGDKQKTKLLQLGSRKTATIRRMFLFQSTIRTRRSISSIATCIRIEIGTGATLPRSIGYVDSLLSS